MDFRLGKPCVLQSTFTDLQQWVRNGIRQIAAVDLMTDPVPVAKGDLKNFGTELLLMQLPDKYRDVLEKYQCMPALVDDIERISLQTEELTAEAQARMEALNISWLPFSFQPAWIATTAPAEKPRSSGDRPKRRQGTEKTGIVPGQTRSKRQQRKKAIGEQTTLASALTEAAMSDGEST